jgi:hypothetical protein
MKRKFLIILLYYKFDKSTEECKGGRLSEEAQYGLNEGLSMRDLFSAIIAFVVVSSQLQNHNAETLFYYFNCCLLC